MKRFLTLSACLVFFLAASRAHSEDGVVLKPLSVGGLWEFGQVRNAVYHIDSDPIKKSWVDHFGAFISQSATVNERLLINVGIGGILEFQEPEYVNVDFTGTQHKVFFVGPTATADYLFGDVQHPTLKVGGGLFQYKYNPDAVNLGEYLFRTGTYPTWIMTGGYTVIDNTAPFLEGFKAESHFGNLSLDFLATTETNMPPLYDWSFSLLPSYKVGNFLEVGGGIMLANYLSANDRTTISDSIQAATLNIRKQFAYPSRGLDTTGLDTNTVYTTKGEKLMGRISFSPLALFEDMGWHSIFGPEDGKLYGEIALIGLKNYSFFYENRWQRTPMMVGFNIPAFKILDRLSFEYEYLKSPWINSTYNLGNDPPVPIPRIPDPSSSTYYKGVTSKDNARWSIYASKMLTKGLTWKAQAAHDHLRLVAYDYQYGPHLGADEALMRMKSWYWMTQFSWGI